MAERPPHILIAEDDESIRELLITRMSLAGYHTSHERNGLAAFDSMTRAPPNACILDVNMPGLDGFEVLRRMRTNLKLVKTPVLILTARRAPDDIRTAIRLGANDYLSKPFSDEQLLARVARILRQRNQPTRAVATI